MERTKGGHHRKYEALKRVIEYLDAKDGKLVDLERLASATGISTERLRRYLRELRKEEEVGIHKVGRKRYWGVI
jgi:DNA-binding IscR family transcriptional regulator